MLYFAEKEQQRDSQDYCCTDKHVLDADMRVMRGDTDRYPFDTNFSDLPNVDDECLQNGPQKEGQKRSIIADEHGNKVVVDE